MGCRHVEAILGKDHATGHRSWIVWLKVTSLIHSFPLIQSLGKDPSFLPVSSLTRLPVGEIDIFAANHRRRSKIDNIHPGFPA